MPESTPPQVATDLEDEVAVSGARRNARRLKAYRHRGEQAQGVRFPLLPIPLPPRQQNAPRASAESQRGILGFECGELEARRKRHEINCYTKVRVAICLC